MKYFLRKCECKMDFRFLRKSIFYIKIIPKGYHILPRGQTSLCASKASYFRKEMHHFPGRENITESCENPFSQLSFAGGLFCTQSRRGCPCGSPPVPLGQGKGRPQGSPLRRRNLCIQKYLHPIDKCPCGVV